MADKKEDFNRQQVIDLKLQRADLYIQIKEKDDIIKTKEHTIAFYKYKLKILSQIIASGSLDRYD